MTSSSSPRREEKEMERNFPTSQEDRDRVLAAEHKRLSNEKAFKCECGLRFKYGVRLSIHRQTQCRLLRRTR
jgi:hypothetical protein